ncbi:hypothetical protein IG631_01489 [Alternaria alternata]|nr:hypothetical protein IG631_01489 [Alternaria alternata]
MASDSTPEICDSLIAGVQHAYVLPFNPFHVSIIDEDLQYWQTKGAIPSSAEAEVIQRAHDRIFSNFRKVLHILERDNSSPTAYHTMILELRRDRFIITNDVPAFRNRRIGELAKFCSIAEAQIQASFPRLQQLLRDEDLYQPYKPSEPLIPAALEYMHSYGHQPLHASRHSCQFENILVRGPSHSTVWDADVKIAIVIKGADQLFTSSIGRKNAHIGDEYRIWMAGQDSRDANGVLCPMEISAWLEARNTRCCASG